MSGNGGAQESTYKHYVLDLARLLKEQALEAKHDSESIADSDKPFARGRLMAYHEVISLMQLQAKAFGLSLSSLGLHDIDPETDLL